MLKKRSDHIYVSTLLESIPGLKHGFSSRILGDMKKNSDNRRKFMKQLGISGLPMMVEQIHGTGIATISEEEVFHSMGMDGLVTNGQRPLGVVTADCIPILLADPIIHVVAALHSGWKGTMGEIATVAITQMKYLGAHPENILAVIGPHIGMCCYNVSSDRAMLFAKKFMNDHKVVSKSSNLWYVDLGYALYLTLLSSGIIKDHIDAPITCTSCQHNEFFSFRKDSKATYGEMMAVISY